MADINDYELLKADTSQEDERAARRPVWIAAMAGVVIAAALVAYWVYSRPRPPASTAPVARAPAGQPQARPLGGAAEPITVPPLDESDPIARQLVRTITSHPLAIAWLTTNGLIRNFTVVVTNVVEGPTPARQLQVLRPAAPFRVADRSGQLFIDAASYDRYNTIAAAAASIDPAGAARVYATLKPRIEQAYGELGQPPASFDRALERAIVVLLQVPVVEGPIRVEPKGGTAYQYADPKLEGLTSAQKQLLRTGPRNVRTIQSALRQLALALGIPSDRLP
jgi:Protein of unknown function (DUF3014)